MTDYEYLTVAKQQVLDSLEELSGELTKLDLKKLELKRRHRDKMWELAALNESLNELNKQIIA